MSFLGHIENGTVVFDAPMPLTNGTPVKVEALDPEPRRIPRSGESPEEWVRYLRELAASQPLRDWDVDVSRDSIYD